MSAKTRRLLLAFALLGLGASSWSSYVHYSLLTVPGYTSFCDVSGKISCTQAYLSQYGSLWGVPVALGGVLFFATVLFIVGFAGQRSVKGRENVPAYVFALSTIGLAFVLYLGWASFFKLNTVCLLCATTYVAVIALFIISGGATTFPMTSLPRRASTDLARLARSPLGLTAVKFRAQERFDRSDYKEKFLTWLFLLCRLPIDRSQAGWPSSRAVAED